MDGECQDARHGRRAPDPDPVPDPDPAQRDPDPVFVFVVRVRVRGSWFVFVFVTDPPRPRPGPFSPPSMAARAPLAPHLTSLPASFAPTRPRSRPRPPTRSLTRIVVPGAAQQKPCRLWP